MRAYLVVVAILAGEGCARPDREPLSGEQIVAARRAVALIPAAVGELEAGRYGRAERRLSALRGALPDSDLAATAATILHLGGAPEYRRLLAAVETNLGLARFRARRYESAIEALRQAVVTDPRSQVAWTNLGIVLLRAHRFPAAVEAFRRAGALGAGDARFQLRAGQAAFYVGDAESARSTLSRAVELGQAEGTLAGRGTGLEALVSLAELDAAAGDLESARGRLEAVLARTPNDPLPRYRLLGVLARQGDTAALAQHRERFEADAAAMAAIQDALGRQPEEVANLHWVAEAYARLGLDDLAEVHYRQLLARDRADRSARRGLAELALRQRAHGLVAEGGATGGGR